MNPYIQTSSTFLFITCIHYHTIGFLVTIVCRGNSMNDPVVGAAAPLTAAPLTASVGILATERLEMDRNGVDENVDDVDGANPDTDAGESESRSAVTAVLKIMIELN
eukprot:CAMPEP_0194085254 /NCGR_PEP_ID=MMETSP0149-20130528/16844_1 /TAXON_ID=122233 /ORGANISM="Chaetoceros debilis, Strain MM31A-1" /LENGTH=106 /DNA_ID=CAMNT_0038768093 /DNA_START=11 /DNA_END=332 /DNA_ORIENTATION=-